MHEEDAEGWLYRGEGSANIVLAYHGRRPSFIGRVLRLRKASKKDDGTQNQVKKEPKPVLSEEEAKLWREWPNMSKATTSAALAHVFACEVMQPLLGEDHVDAGLLVFLTTGFLEAVSRDVLAKQREWRRNDSKMDMTAGVALLITDHSLFPIVPGRVKDLPQTITIEIKPKWGYLPDAATISEENSVKRHVTRFAMHQHLKLQQGKIKTMSKYCPLDLFSGNVEGIHKALVQMFETPQNNIRIFLKGVEIFGGPEDGGSTNELMVALEEKLGAVMVAPEGERVLIFQRLVASVLNKSKVLDQLLRLQKLDTYAIEGANLAYSKFTGMTDDAGADDESEAGSEEVGAEIDSRPVSTVGFGRVCIENLALEPEDTQKKRDKAWIKSLSWEESRCVVRNFLIAATAKDCGIMLTLRPLYNEHGTPFSVPSASVATCPTTGQQYVSKIAFLDLDTKRLKKIPVYYSLDQQIVDTYKACSQQLAKLL